MLQKIVQAKQIKNGIFAITHLQQYDSYELEEAKTNSFLKLMLNFKYVVSDFGRS